MENNRQHPGHAVHQIIFPAGGAGSAIDPLTSVLESPAGPAREAAIKVLSKLLAHGDARPDALAEAILLRLQVLHFYRHERDPQWRYGTFLTRKMLIDELYARAKTIGPTAPAETVELARGALLLAAQEPMYCVPFMHLLAFDTDFDALSGWHASALEQVRDLLRTQMRQTKDFFARYVSAESPLKTIIQSAPGSAPFEAFELTIAILEEMVPFAAGRPDLQSRVVNLTWRVLVLARARQNQQGRAEMERVIGLWRQQFPEAHFHRWLDEVLASNQADIKTVGFRRLSRSEFLARRVETDASPPAQ